LFLQGIRLGSKALHLVTRQKKYIVGGILKLKNAMVNMRLLWTLQANLDLRKIPIFESCTKDLWYKIKKKREETKKLHRYSEFAS